MNSANPDHLTDQTDKTALRVPVAANAALAALVVGLDTLFLFAPVPEQIHSPSQWLCLLPVFVLITPTHWGLVHEGIHGRLATNYRRNRICARALTVLLGFSFDLVQFGHLMHHRFNGHDQDRPDRIKPGESMVLAYARHYGHLLCGHYLFTILMGLLAFVPLGVRGRLIARPFGGNDPESTAIRASCLRWFGNPRKMLRARFDSLLALAIIILAFMRYGEFWPLLVIGLLGRAFVYSLLDNLPHHGVPGRGNAAAKNFRLPGWAAVLVLRHNLHRVHHEHMELPWTHILPTLAGEYAPQGYVRAAIGQLGPPSRY